MSHCDLATVYDNSGLKGLRIVAQMSDGFIAGSTAWPDWTPQELQSRWPTLHFSDIERAAHYTTQQAARESGSLGAARGLTPVPATLVAAAIEPWRSHLCFGELEGGLEEAGVVQRRNHVADVSLRKPQRSRRVVRGRSAGAIQRHFAV